MARHVLGAELNPPPPPKESDPHPVTNEQMIVMTGIKGVLHCRDLAVPNLYFLM